MKPSAVLDAVRHIMYTARADEARRLDQINEAMKPWTYEHAVNLLASQGRSDEPVMGMKWRSQTNMLPLVVGTYSQAMKIDNYLASDTKDTAKGPWEWWQRNKMDARQTGLIRGVLKYGAAFTTVLPSMTPAAARRGPEKPGAFIRCLSPRQMTAMYGEPIEWTPGETPADDDWPTMALEIKGSMIRFYDEEKVHFLGAKLVPQSALGWSEPIYQHPDNFDYLEGRSHGVGVCPVVRFRDRWDMDGEEQYGIVEPLLAVQSRINETEYNKGAAEYFTAFIQRWVAGWRPQDEMQALEMAAGDVWYFTKSDVKVGQFDQGDLKAYNESGQASRMDFAAIAQLPPHALGLSQLVNISEATLAALETGKKRNTSEIQTSLGESFEQMFRTTAHITGDTKAAEDFQSEAKWADLTARTLAETIDALGKMSAMLDIPDEILYEDIPGKTKAWVDRVIKKKKELQDEMARQMQDGQIPPGQGRPAEPNQNQPVEAPPVGARLNGERAPVPPSP